ncbi:hypothetical protein SEPCBS119000_003174 [Sporothrix epigloea]|uniref:Nickel/cobalt efflux system n=1 Tax=Sporothrix epigloea TaxID=1892477 RepID=A0ABP0DM65_9PEZI
MAFAPLTAAQQWLVPRLPRRLRSIPLPALLLISLLVLVNLVAWAVVGVVLRFYPKLTGTAVLAYTLGLRHALDADHISAIDLMTRRLIAAGQRPVSVGTFFSLGHSTVVIVTCIVVAATSGALRERFNGFERVGNIIGTSVSAAVLLILCAGNAWVLWRLVSGLRAELRKRQDSALDDDLEEGAAGQVGLEPYRDEEDGNADGVDADALAEADIEAGETAHTRHSHGSNDHTDAPGPITVASATARENAMTDSSARLRLEGGGFLVRIFRKLFVLIDRPWKMYPLGVMFGLGFDTSSEVALIGIASIQGAQGTSLWLILIFPALFTAGMCMMDTTDGALMMVLYTSKTFSRDNVAILYYSIVLTGITIVVAAFIGTIQVLTLVSSVASPSGHFWDGVNTIGDNFDIVGGSICGLFLLAGVGSVLVYKPWRRRMDRKLAAREEARLRSEAARDAADATPLVAGAEEPATKSTGFAASAPTNESSSKLPAYITAAEVAGSASREE